MGYWSYLIKSQGGSVVSFDNGNWQKFTEAWEEKDDVYGMAYLKDSDWLTPQEGSYEKLSEYPDHTLFLCWPPYDEDLAYDCLKNYKGNVFIYVGEWYGCTGDDDFHKLLEDEWTEIENIDIPNWYGIHDRYMVFIRK